MKKKIEQWEWWVILLWAYSTLISLAMGVTMIFFPAWVNEAPTTSSIETVVSGIVVFFPQLIFLILIGKRNIRNRD